MKKQTIANIDVKNKRVFIRVDFNVPLDEKQRITDDSRIVKSLPTIRYAMEHGAKVILASHLGRPDGKPSPQYSLRPVASHLSKLLGSKVNFLEDCVGLKIEEQIHKMRGGEVVLLENLRFHAEEEKNNPKFAQALSRLADLYVNDAFGAAHRAHASTEGIAHFLPSAAGFLFAKEVEYLGGVLKSPKRPFVTILGGSKVSDKIKVTGNLLDRTEKILVGGAMAYPFCLVKGYKIGSSKYESGGEKLAKEVLDQADRKGVPILLPIDHVIAQKLEKGVQSRVVEKDIPDGWLGLDIGPKTVNEFKKALSNAKTILWNGPVGVFEVPPFDKGSREIAEFISILSATTIIGGGDTAAAIKKFGLEEKMSHVSTGGGASLEFLEGRVLPGIAALPEQEEAAKV